MQVLEACRLNRVFPSLQTLQHVTIMKVKAILLSLSLISVLSAPTIAASNATPTNPEPVEHRGSGRKDKASGKEVTDPRQPKPISNKTKAIRSRLVTASDLNEARQACQELVGDNEILKGVKRQSQDTFLCLFKRL